MKKYLRLGAVMLGMTVAKAAMRCARGIRNEYRDIEALRAAQQYDQSTSSPKAFWLGLVAGCRAAPRAYFAPLRGIVRAVKGDAV